MDEIGRHSSGGWLTFPYLHMVSSDQSTCLSQTNKSCHTEHVLFLLSLVSKTDIKTNIEKTKNACELTERKLPVRKCIT